MIQYLMDIIYEIKPLNLLNKLCNWILNPALNNAQTQSIDYNTFKDYVKSKLDSSNSNRALLFWINTEDNIITNLEMQYTP